MSNLNPEEMTVEQCLEHVRDGKAVDQKHFKEERSNIRLFRGDHFIDRNTNGSDSTSRIKGVNKRKRPKLRITVNHIQKACKIYANHIINIAPGVAPSPKNPEEESDIKVADMSNQLWDHLKYVHNISAQNQKSSLECPMIGEIFMKVTWDQNKGKPVPGEVKVQVDALTGEMLGKPYQEMVVPGDVDYERIYGYNLLRDPDAKSWEDCRWVIQEKVIDTKDLKAQFPDAQIETSDSVDDVFQVFDSATSNYFSSNNAGKSIVYEMFFRPRASLLDGYFIIFTDKEELAKGKLPLGEFPIYQCTFDEVPGSPRGYSLIKQARSPQIEINRCYTKIAEHHIAGGDDTILTQKGSKIQAGGYAAGVKAIQYSGMTPTVLQGRDGSQFSEHLQRSVETFYQLLDIDNFVEKPGGQDMMAQIHRNLREKEKFSIYGQKLQKFYEQICRISLKLYKHYASDEALTAIFGEDERISLPEFRKTDDIDYQIKLEAVTEDVDTKFARMTVFRDYMQYADLTPEVQALLVKNMPFANVDELTKEVTLDYTVCQNIKLALDREQFVPVDPNENHLYMLKQLRARTRQPDYMWGNKISDVTKQMYEGRINQHRQIQMENVIKQQMLNDGFIPTGGDVVTVNMTIQVTDAEGGSKMEKMKMPVETLNWVRDRLAKQGWAQDDLAKLTPEMQANMGEQKSQFNPQASQMQTEDLGINQ